MVWGGLRWFLVVCGNSMDRRGGHVVVVSRSLLFQENHVDTCEFLRFNTLRLN